MAFATLNESVALDAGRRWAVIEAFLGDPAAWLPEGSRPAGLDRWFVTLHAGPVSAAVAMTIDRSWSLPDAYSRPVTWAPAATADDGTATGLLPDFWGRLTLRVEEGTLRLVLSGRYQPPGGRAGMIADTAALHLVAAATARRLLADVAERLVARPRSPVGRAG